MGTEIGEHLVLCLLAQAAQLGNFGVSVQLAEMLLVEGLEVALGLVLSVGVVLFIVSLGEVAIEGVFFPLLTQHLGDVEVQQWLWR
jgi:hypothetical protein